MEKILKFSLEQVQFGVNLEEYVQFNKVQEKKKVFYMRRVGKNLGKRGLLGIRCKNRKVKISVWGRGSSNKKNGDGVHTQE